MNAPCWSPCAAWWGTWPLCRNEAFFPEQDLDNTGAQSLPVGCACLREWYMSCVCDGCMVWGTHAVYMVYIYHVCYLHSVVYKRWAFHTVFELYMLCVCDLGRLHLLGMSCECLQVCMWCVCSTCITDVWRGYMESPASICLWVCDQVSEPQRLCHCQKQ